MNELDSEFDSLAPSTFYYNRFVAKEDVNSVSAKLREFYFGDTAVSYESRDNLTDLYSDSLFVYGIRESAILTAANANKSPVYLYEFAHQIKSFLGILASLPEHESKSKFL